jgi:hypothetical protein
MRKSLTWAAVGTTLVAAAATLSVAGTANAATVKPTLFIRDSASHVNAGSPVTISGTLSAGHTVLGNEGVWLDWVGPKGALHKIKDKPTAAKTGVVTFTVAPEATTTYELVFPGTRSYARATSGKAVVRVSKLGTNLAIAAPTTPITVGAKETFTGTLDHGTTPLPGKTVWLYTVNSKKKIVHAVGHASTSSTGTVSITTTPPVGTDYYAFFYAGNWQYAHSASNADKVVVDKITTQLGLTSSVTTPVTKGTKVTLTGTLTAGTPATPLKGRTVVLQVLVNGKWVNANAGAGTTSATGTVTFTRTPSVTTSYRVVFPAAPDYTNASSTAVVITIS